MVKSSYCLLAPNFLAAMTNLRFAISYESFQCFSQTHIILLEVR